MQGKIRTATLLLISSFLLGCATAQTTYFRGSYVELASAEHSKLKTYKGEPEFELVDNMESRAQSLHENGYAMLGYSQFISPLFKNLSQSYATKYARMKNARHVVLEEPQPGFSNLHYYLVTYWGELKSDSYPFGAYFTELPDELRQKMDEDMHMVIVDKTIPFTPAARAGIRPGDVIYAVNGNRMTSVGQLLDKLGQHQGENVTVQLMRNGEDEEIPIQLAQAIAPGKNDKNMDFSVAPWTRTEPRDWSSLSFAAIAQANLRTWQRMEMQRQAEAERARAVARANLAYLESQYGTDNRNSGSNFVSPSADPREVQKAMAAASDYMRKEQGRKQLDTMNAWFGNAKPLYLGGGR